MLKPNDLPLVCLPLELPVEAVAELLEFLHELTNALERHYAAQLKDHYDALTSAARARRLAVLTYCLCDQTAPADQRLVMPSSGHSAPNLKMTRFCNPANTAVSQIDQSSGRRVVRLVLVRIVLAQMFL
jgi:hypothetical protein